MARARSRGFTLAELLIVVAMIGVMAALATVGYRKYLHSAGTAEAKAVMQGIRAAEDSYKSEMLVYVSPSSDLGDYYPNKTPDSKTRMNWIQPGDGRYTDPTKGWKLLHVTTDGPVRFGYAAVAGVGGQPPAPPKFASPPSYPTVGAGTPWFVVVAAGDRNDNSKFALFMSTSFGSEIYVENEDE